MNALPLSLWRACYYCLTIHCHTHIYPLTTHQCKPEKIYVGTFQHKTSLSSKLIFGKILFVLLREHTRLHILSFSETFSPIRFPEHYRFITPTIPRMMRRIKTTDILHNSWNVTYHIKMHYLIIINNIPPLQKQSILMQNPIPVYINLLSVCYVSQGNSAHPKPFLYTQRLHLSTWPRHNTGCLQRNFLCLLSLCSPRNLSAVRICLVGNFVDNLRINSSKFKTN